jgi:chitinase
MRTFILLLVSVTILAGCRNYKQQPDTSGTDKVIIGYVFPGNRIINPEEIAAEKLTHINYAFANIQDGKIIEGFQNDSVNFAVLNSLKNRNPGLKILISVGGWSWSGNFSDMALTPESREIFIRSSLEFMQKHQIDGLDIDWEYPGLPGNNNTFRVEDRENFVALLKECREAFDQAVSGIHYLLTIAAGSTQSFIRANDMENVSRHLDFVNLMTYDFSGEWNDQTGHHTNPYTSDYTVAKYSTDHAVRIFMDAGVPREKMVIGAAFYGRGWKHVAPGAHHGLDMWGKGPVGQRLTYDDIVRNILTDNNYTKHWDASARAPYLYNSTDSIFITYEDPASIKEKCTYILENNLKGIMFWQYFGDHEGELLNAINEGLKP